MKKSADPTHQICLPAPMPTLIKFRRDDGPPVIVDVTSRSEAAINPVSIVSEVLKEAENSFDDALRVAGQVAQDFEKVMTEFALKEAELEVGFKFTAKGNIYIVQAEGEAAIRVKIIFKR